MKFLYALGMSLLSTKVLAGPACPVCTVAIGASLGIARQLGVDDCVVGVWAGAMLAMIGYWLIRWFDKKGWVFTGYKQILMASSIAMIGLMYISELTYEPSIIWGIFFIDSFLFTTLLGAVVLIFGMHLYQWMKAKNGGHAHFPFEKVVVPVLLVLVTSVLIAYFPVCNCAKGEGVVPVTADVVPSFD